MPGIRNINFDVRHWVKCGKYEKKEDQIIDNAYDCTWLFDFDYYRYIASDVADFFKKQGNDTACRCFIYSRYIGLRDRPCCIQYTGILESVRTSHHSWADSGWWTWGCNDDYPCADITRQTIIPVSGAFDAGFVKY